VANNVLEPDAGFEVATNRVVIYDAARGRAALPLMSKRAVAGQLLDRVATLWLKRTKEERAK
jgi:phosphopantothenoylcysteine decarboxylase/phosphopantothenate--cysteine ligase